MSSFYVRKLKSGKWSVIEQSFVEGKPVYKTVPRSRFSEVGLVAHDTTDQMKAAIRTLNKANSEKRKQLRIANRTDPADGNPLAREFLNKLSESNFGSERHQAKIESHWRTIQRMLAVLKIEPAEFAESSKSIYQYLIKKRFSPDYVGKLLRILNMWGKFVCKKHRQPYEKVDPPGGHVRSKIEEANIDGKYFRGENDPLTPELLETSRNQILVSNYNWLLISLWFGLRPKEIDCLKIASSWRVEENRSLGVKVLWIYQAKLTSIERIKRWKPIPVIFPEQVLALEIIFSGEFRRPLTKTFARVFNSKRLRTYSGRKGFVDLMLNRKQSLEDISMWLGHQNIETTWRKYRNKRRVSFTRINGEVHCGS